MSAGGAEGPDGGPNALALGETGADIDLAILKGEGVFGLNGAGGVDVGGAAPRPIVGGGLGGETGVGAGFGKFACGELQGAGALADVGEVGGIPLGFTIADEAFFVGPLGCVGGTGAVEFVGEDEFPFRGEGGCCPKEEHEREQSHVSHDDELLSIMFSENSTIFQEGACR